jgi:hypothetical protein
MIEDAKRYQSTILAIPRGMALDMGVIEPTPAERVERERRAAEYERRAAARRAALDAARPRLAALADPLARAILDLHSENREGECVGCEFTGYEAEAPEWPCSTVEAVATHYGISLEAA